MACVAAVLGVMGREEKLINEGFAGENRSDGFFSVCGGCWR
jgi:hypothetical protein